MGGQITSQVNVEFEHIYMVSWAYIAGGSDLDLDGWGEVRENFPGVSDAVSGIGYYPMSGTNMQKWSKLKKPSVSFAKSEDNMYDRTWGVGKVSGTVYSLGF